VTPIWLIYHQRLRQETELRALLDAVIEQAEAARDVLQGLVDVSCAGAST
jgi:hypothetical protein